MSMPERATAIEYSGGALWYIPKRSSLRFRAELRNEMAEHTKQAKAIDQRNAERMENAKTPEEQRSAVLEYKAEVDDYIADCNRRLLIVGMDAGMTEGDRALITSEIDSEFWQTADLDAVAKIANSFRG